MWMALWVSSALADTTIVFVRHGEKPPAGRGQLSRQGLNRELALPLALKLAAGQMFRNLCKQPDLFKLPMVCSQFEQMLFLNLLTLQPQVMASGRLQVPMDVLPKTIKLAEDYMRAHLDEDITMETLVHLTGASMRSLYEGFRKHREAPRVSRRPVGLSQTVAA